MLSLISLGFQHRNCRGQLVIAPGGLADSGALRRECFAMTVILVRQMRLGDKRRSSIASIATASASRVFIQSPYLQVGVLFL
jgi:hypothetical protein